MNLSTHIKAESIETAPKDEVETPGRRIVRRLRSDPMTLSAIILLGLIILMAIFAPLIAGDPYEGSALTRLKPIGTEGHWLGTDEIGRDMWARIAFGARASLIAGFVPICLALIAGGGLGVIAGYCGGRVNGLIMRTMDIFYAFPAILLAIVVCAIVGNGLMATVIALSIVFVPPLVRITETVTTRVRNMEFIDAARASGVSDWKIVLVQVLPNIMGPVLVYAASLASLSIVLAAGLSFLGLGVPPPTPEWGQMLNSLRQAIYVQPMLSAIPGLMIFLTSVSLNLISDGLRGALDVRLQD